MTTWLPPPEGQDKPGASAKPSVGRRFLDWLFAVPAGKRSVWTIIWWWELRRLPYNLIVGSVGVCSLLLFFFFITHSGELRPGEDAEEPLGIIVAPFLMNICYCGGALLEIVLRWLSRGQAEDVGPRLLRTGLIFSLVVVMIPSVLWGLIWISRVL